MWNFGARALGGGELLEGGVERAVAARVGRAAPSLEGRRRRPRFDGNT